MPERTSVPQPDEWVEIQDCLVAARIGVPVEEREFPQTLSVTLRYQMTKSFADLADDFSATIDYSAVAARIRWLAERNSCRLLESLAAAMADDLMQVFRFRSLELTIKKFILPGTAHVSVSTVIR